MAETLDFESDLQLVALTDALRAGPGSPEWRDAVARIRAQGGDQADEYLLLCTAREHLASGKSYRYFDVDDEENQALRRAFSKGAHFNRHIKPLHRFMLLDERRRA